MPENRRIVALSIGVSDAPPLPYLRGAVNSAQGFHKWAAAAGYQAILLTDDNGPITLARLRNELDAILRPGAGPVHRLVLYFAGHGLIREAEEGLWLLSDWHNELRAVAIEVLKRRLRMYHVKQITIIADACRSLPPDIDAADLTADGVLGRGQSNAQTMPDVDKFIAAQDGTATFMIPGENPEDDRCLFSAVLLEGLWGTKPAAFSAVRTNLVTSNSLGTYLKSEVAKIAERYKYSLNPSVAPTFPEGDDIYLDVNTQNLTPPAFLPWPAPEKLLLRAQAAASEKASFQKAAADGEQRANALLQEIRTQSRPTHFETQSGVAVAGGPVAAVWTSGDIHFERLAQPGWWRIHHTTTYYLERPAPVLCEFADGLFAGVTALPHFIGSLLRNERGVSALIYRGNHAEASVARKTEEAIALMESGVLRTDTTIDYATKLRQEKHDDPVYGVISAYLYDSIDDIESIRQMAYYYIQHDQPIPYDIAVLAELRGELRDGLLWARVPKVPLRKARTEAEEQVSWAWHETPAAEGWVGGLWPWMRQGWDYLDNPAADGSTLVLPGLIELTKHLRPARFTTLDREGGQALARVFNLLRQGA